MALRILLILFLLNSFGETFRYPPIHPGWTNAGRSKLPTKVGRQSGAPPEIDPVISREKALILIGLFAEILGDLSALHKKQGTYICSIRVLFRWQKSFKSGSNNLSSASILKYIIKNFACYVVSI